MNYQAPSEKMMWLESEPKKALKRSVYEMIEKYELGEQRLLLESNRIKLPNFVEKLKYKPDYMVLPPLSHTLAEWDAQKQSRLIESFITNFPVPPILLYQRHYNSYEVIDGQQRIRAIKEFYQNKLVLTGLELWPELNGMKYDDLPSIIQRAINRKSIEWVAILKNDNLEEEEAQRLRQLAFERLSTQGVSREKQEIRNALYKGPFNDLLVKLSANEVFRQAWNLPKYPKKEKPNGQGIDFKTLQSNEWPSIEKILRFFALRHVKQYQPGIQRFINRYMMHSLKFTPNDICFLEALYIRTINLAASIYGEFLFRPYLPDKHAWSDTPQTAFHDTIMVALARYLDQAETLIERREKVIAETINLFVNHESGTFTSKDEEKEVLSNRISLFSDMLGTVLEGKLCFQSSLRRRAKK